MTLLEKYIHCMEIGDNVGLAELFDEYGVLHDSSLGKAKMDTMHLEGRMAIEMMFHHKFGFNGGPFKIRNVEYKGKDTVEYFIHYGRTVIPVTATLEQEDENGKIKYLRITPI
ncbi:hypothetical protein [Youxingia wuxianensis]|uniref:SnoaL-like domain-containing protein n=1 Tax=Youxingia wuxianensis TaxID=2763678 RepID=A0A926ESE6_9FIRM|nr:hypothetical protein [Youxingia wuxianensis]MBC8585757.1 hypothetical protein [Youxingia wuxianensis]